MTPSSRIINDTYDYTINNLLPKDNRAKMGAWRITKITGLFVAARIASIIEKFASGIFNMSTGLCTRDGSMFLRGFVQFVFGPIQEVAMLIAQVVSGIVNIYDNVDKEFYELKLKELRNPRCLVDYGLTDENQ